MKTILQLHGTPRLLSSPEFGKLPASINVVSY